MTDSKLEDLLTTLGKIRPDSLTPNAMSQLEPLLTDKQWQRLTEIAYHIEIARNGFATALTEGKLARDIGFVADQKKEITEVGTKLESRFSTEIVAILEEAQKELLSRLTPEQRSKAIELLGTPFHFRDENFKFFLR